MGLSDAVLVAAPPVRPVQPVGPVSPGRRDDDVAQEPQQSRDGDRDQPGVGVLSLPPAQAGPAISAASVPRPGSRKRSASLGNQDALIIRLDSNTCTLRV